MKNDNILLFQRIIPTYRISVFNELYKKYKIIICYSQFSKSSSLKSKHKSIDFPVELIKGIYLFSNTQLIQNPISVLFRYKPKIVISEGSSSYLTLWLLRFFKPFFHYKIAIWTHGIKSKELQNPFSSLSTKLSYWNFKSADAILTYSSQRKKILSKYINGEKIFVAINTINTEQYRNHFIELTRNGKSKIKEELGIKHKFNLVFIGRLLKNKSIMELMQLHSELPEELDIALHIIGNGPEKQSVENVIKHNQNQYYHGEIFDDSVSGKYLFISDLFIMLSRIGLSVIHSFCYGCPVITLNEKIQNHISHGPEKDLIVHNYNGYLCNDLDNLKEILLAHMTSSRKTEIEKNALNTALEKAPISKMINGFGQIIKFLDGPTVL